MIAFVLSASRPVFFGPYMIYLNLHKAGWKEVLLVMLGVVVSDILDGVVAKRLGGKCKSGGQIDSISDKIFTAELLYDYSWEYPLPVIPTALIIMQREVEIGVLRWRMEKLGISFDADMPGKVKAVFQYLFIGAVGVLRSTAPEYIHTAAFWTSVIGGVIAIVLTLYSQFWYYKKADGLLLAHYEKWAEEIEKRQLV
ncbi:MAG: hypothetical protein PHS53_02280 [Candidatus Pacebacteria bacterium]|nr:hypothetical protein [Candidatus Paceibacterota bacterium]